MELLHGALVWSGELFCFTEEKQTESYVKYLTFYEGFEIMGDNAR
jgi:hypothetical protein